MSSKIELLIKVTIFQLEKIYGTSAEAQHFIKALISGLAILDHGAMRVLFKFTRHTLVLARTSGDATPPGGLPMMSLPTLSLGLYIVTTSSIYMASFGWDRLGINIIRGLWEGMRFVAPNLIFIYYREP